MIYAVHSGEGRLALSFLLQRIYAVHSGKGRLAIFESSAIHRMIKKIIKNSWKIFDRDLSPPPL
jgi:hypothetical protein